MKTDYNFQNLENLEARLLMSALPLPQLAAMGTELAVPASGQVIVNGSIQSQNANIYTYTAPATGSVTFSMNAAGKGVDPFLEIVDALSGRLLASNNNISGSNINSQIKLSVTAGKTYYIQAKGYKTTSGAYSLTAASTPVDDYGNTNATAQSLGMSQNSNSITGTVNYSGDIDVFKIQPGIAGKLTITLVPTGTKTLAGTIALGNGVTQTLVSATASGSGSAVSTTYTVDKNGVYYVRVGGDASRGTYQLQVKVEATMPTNPTIPVVTTAASTITATTTQFGAGWQLLVVGTNGADNITISQTSGGITLTTPSGSKSYNGSFVSVVIYGFDGNDTIRTTSTVTSSVYVSAGNGDDTVYNAATGLGTILTGNGNNTVVSIGAGKATITGGTGMDSFWVDAADTLTGVSAATNAAAGVHMVSSFYQPFSSSSSNAKYVPLTIAGQSLADPTIDSYASAYKSFASSPLFGTGGAKYGDIRQGSCGDCYFMAALGSLSQTDPQAITQAITALGDGTYAVRFYRNGVANYVRVDADLPVTSGGSLSYARVGAQGQIWVALMEKAYAFFRVAANSYASLWGGWMGDASKDVTNASYSAVAVSTGSTNATLLSTIQTNLSAGHGVTVASRSTNVGPIFGNHAYQIVSTTATTITVYNPWGVDGTTYDSNPSDGLLTLSIDQFKQAFCYLSICNL